MLGFLQLEGIRLKGPAGLLTTHGTVACGGDGPREAFLELKAVLGIFQPGWQIAFPCATAKRSTLVAWAKKGQVVAFGENIKPKGIDGCQAGMGLGL